MSVFSQLNQKFKIYFNILDKHLNELLYKIIYTS